MSHEASRVTELVAPADWQAIELISDLHLDAAHPKTLEAFRLYLKQSSAGAIFILGDLFEAWVGDDAADVPDSFAHGVACLLKDAATLRPMHFMHGNRDFLVGEAFMGRTGLKMLADPTTLVFGEHRWLLSHGDALCLADTVYQRFRAQVRSPAWQRAVLAKPLAEREALAHAMRAGSRAHQNAGAGSRAHQESDPPGTRHAGSRADVPSTDVDLDTPATLTWLQAAGADVLIHGHTHRPQDHALDARHRRIVLSDWDCDESAPPRGEVLRLGADGTVTRRPLGG